MSAIFCASRHTWYAIALAVVFHVTAICDVEVPSLAATPVGALIAYPTNPVSPVLDPLTPAVKTAFTV